MLKLKLEELLYNKRMNANQLSKETGIRYPTILDMVGNKSKHWSIENLEAIMVALEIEDIGELIEYVRGDK